jgi:hypothetical protein
MLQGRGDRHFEEQTSLFEPDHGFTEASLEAEGHSKTALVSVPQGGLCGQVTLGRPKDGDTGVDHGREIPQSRDWP